MEVFYWSMIGCALVTWAVSSYLVSLLPLIGA